MTTESIDTLGSVDLHRAGLIPAAAAAGGRSTPPRELHVAPAGPVAEAADGRSFRIEDPDAVIAASRMPAMLDVDHASFLTGDTRAYGWVDRLEYLPEARDGKAAGFWAHVESWTPKGAEMIADKEFRFISPAVRFHKRDGDDEGGLPVLRAFVNFGLTNRPNLTMSAIHAQQARRPAPGASSPSLQTDRGLTRTGLNAQLDAMVATHTRRGAIPSAYSEHFRALAAKDPSGVSEALEASAAEAEARMLFCRRYGIPYRGTPAVAALLETHGIDPERFFAQPMRSAGDEAAYASFCARFGFPEREPFDPWAASK
ncbi:MAG: hypothetical protein CMN30_08315 [Sandaracinus sp.]|nr:hypothetical protein [Sandaracinus sp.]|tara:strand:- start:926 stop:1867 length:942 start_codon:yes stop_codon:yes gene_type:complete